MDTAQLALIIFGAIWPILGIVAFYVKNRSGSVDYIVQMAKDVTDLKRDIKEKIDDKEERLKSVEENMFLVKARIGLSESGGRF